MRHALALVAMLLALPLFGCNSTGGGGGATTGPAAGGGRQVRTLTIDGRQRRYELYVPPRAASAAGHPVVIAMHGAGSTIASLARASGFDALGMRDGYAIAYPQGINARFDTRANSSDVRFVRAILDDLDAAIGIDRGRIHATGFSNGGFLSYRLAKDLPNTFASIAPVAGLMSKDMLPAGTRTSLLHVHGSADRVVSGGGRGGYGAFSGAQAWAVQAGCAMPGTDRRPADASPLAVLERSWRCPSGVQVGVVWIEGKGHTWPQESGGWLSRRIWQFFRETGGTTIR